VSGATARLELSRERLRLAMDPPPDPAEKQRAHGWTDSLRAWPVVREVLDSVRHWWSIHPLRPVGLVAGEAAGAVVRPVAQRHPWLLVLGAAVVGAALAWGRPWRWLLRSTLFAGLVPQLASRVASSLPIDAWMRTVGAMMSTPAKRRPAPAASPAPAPEPSVTATRTTP
jgi:hypothetical protein